MVQVSLIQHSAQADQIGHRKQEVVAPLVYNMSTVCISTNHYVRMEVNLAHLCQQLEDIMCCHCFDGRPEKHGRFCIKFIYKCAEELASPALVVR